VSCADQGGQVDQPPEQNADDCSIELATPTGWAPSGSAAQCLLNVLIGIRRRLASGDAGHHE
jgi:hypothetical protein